MKPKPNEKYEPVRKGGKWEMDLKPVSANKIALGETPGTWKIIPRSDRCKMNESARSRIAHLVNRLMSEMPGKTAKRET